MRLVENAPIFSTILFYRVCCLVEYRPTTYLGFMDDSRPTDELDGLRQFLNRLETRELTVRRGPLDVSQEANRHLETRDCTSGAHSRPV